MNNNIPSWKKVRAECPDCACGYVGHMTADELKERAATDEVDLSCPVCGMIHLSREEIEEQEGHKICESLRFKELQKQAEGTTGHG